MTRHPLVFVLLLLPGTVVAQICDVSMSFETCIRELNERVGRMETDAAEDAAQAAQSAAARDLARVNTGNVTGEATATDDFNPKLQLGANAAGVSGTNDGGVSFSWGDFFRGLIQERFFGEDGTAEGVGQHHKLVVKLEEPELFEPLRNALTDASVRDELSRSLDDFDNVSADLRFSIDSRRYGRNLQRHVDLIEAIQRPALDAVRVEIGAAAAALDVEDQLLQQEGLANVDLTRPMRDVLAPSSAERLVVVAEAAYRAQLDFAERYEAEVRARGLFDLVQLVNNQPQLLLSVESRIRDDLVGPDERGLKLTFEVGSANVNRFRRYQSSLREREPDGVCADVVRCLDNYMLRNRDAIAAGNRATFSLAWLDRDPFEYQENGVQLRFDSERTLVAEMGYGRYVRTGLADLGVGGRSRIDITARYEDVRGDPDRQNRTVANVTFAQEVADGLFFTVGLVWASKPEYRGAVDEELSARAGISYKLAPR